ncbi:MAG: HAD family hydrolase [Proteobacteria bacterium]|nr:HAD family hydrolase [Pseudomonadota bacterium]
MTLPAPKAIIFDWDNTLVDTWPVIHAAMVETFKYMGHTPWTLEETKEKVRRSMRDAFPELFGDRWEEAGKMYQKAYLASHLSALKALPGAVEVLKAIQQRGVLCVLVSNKKGPTLRKEVENMGWGAYFHRVIGADDAARDKPHADPVHMALEATHITPAPDVWFVGDSDVDLECAQETGCTPILYGESAKDHVAYTLTHFHNVPFERHVYDHRQLMDLLAEVLPQKHSA